MQIPDSQAESRQTPVSPARQRRKILITATLALFFGWLFSANGMGLGVMYVIIPNLILIPRRLYRASRFPGERKLQYARVLIWLATIGIIFLVHSLREDIHRKNANEIVARIDDYSTRHGHCPARIEDTGMSTAEFRGKLGSPSYYLCDDNAQVLVYATSFMVFERRVYDFRKRSWHTRAD
jgi:hypothetical protein